MFVKHHKLAIAIAIAAMGAGTAQAQDAERDIWSVSGYGTVGVVHSSEDQADYTSTIDPPIGAGYTDSTSASPDTRAAIQVDGKFTDKFSMVVQVVSEMDHDKSYEPQVQAANVKYQFTPAMSMRAGRFIAPFYMLSESRRIGYAMPWVRPPSEVYNTAFAVDGVDASYRFNAGDVAISSQVFYGYSDNPLLKIYAMGGVNVQADFGSSSLRAAHIRAKVDLKNATVASYMNLYRKFGFTALADQWEVKGDKAQFSEIGYSYDPGKWFFKAEVTRITGDEDFLGKNTRMYASAGWRVGKFTPYATYARVNVDNDLTIGAADKLGIINSVLASSTNVGRKSLTVGTRWDFRENMDFKLEMARVDNSDKSNGDLTNRQPGFVAGQSYNLISASIDFVY